MRSDFSATATPVDSSSSSWKDTSDAHCVTTFDLQPPNSISFRDFYSIPDTVSWIQSFPEGERICLQFPDELLVDATRVVDALQSETSRKYSLSILADTSYGPCCVDFVAAEHVHSKTVIHYGRSCFSHDAARQDRIHFVPTRQQHLDILQFASQTSSLSNAVFLVDFPYAHLAEQFQRILSECCASTPKAAPTTSTTASIQTSAIDRVLVLGHLDTGMQAWLLNSIAEYDVVVVGSYVPSLMVQLSYARSLLHYNPLLNTMSSLATLSSRTLKKRYYWMQRAKESSSIGLLMGTLSSASQVRLIQALQKLLRAVCLRVHIVAVGKVNVPKLANLHEFVDMWCVLGCPYTTLVDSKDFSRPLITPHELLLALWQEYFDSNAGTVTVMMSSLDQVAVLAEDLLLHVQQQQQQQQQEAAQEKEASKPASESDAADDGENETAESDVSLMTGKLVLRDRHSSLAVHSSARGRSAADVLRDRQWSGLESSRESAHAIQESIKQGRSGIPMSYHES
eukprot:ANDGO_08311.mRNA.1 Diphthamide biosynthesis protein 2